MFGAILIAVFTVMHIYVFSRAGSVPFISRHLPRWILIWAGAILWGIFFFAWVSGHGGAWGAGPLELFGMDLMAVVFLSSISLMAVDLVTLGGFLLPRISLVLRGWALLVGMMLSLVALYQGLRPPVITEYNVTLSSLPAEMDGTVVVALSDLHLGSTLNERWLAARILQVQAQRPDLVVLLGDIFEGHGPSEEHLLTTLRQLTAPLGVWVVPGNHEFYHGGKMSLFGKAGFTLLRNEWAEVRPGFVLAGVDDLTAKRRNGREEGDDLIAAALTGRPPGATILLSHTPWQAEKAAASKVGLMLSGHTHGGQIWPFNYLVQQWYPLLAGHYQVGGTTVIVSRGTGTWGPRMRLWQPGEIIRVILHPPQGSIKPTS